MTAVPIATTPDLSLSSTQLLFEGNYQTGYMVPGTNTNYDIALDGRFVMIQPETPKLLNIILDWTEELKRLAPRY
jgi:hypothetical protein